MSIIWAELHYRLFYPWTRRYKFIVFTNRYKYFVFTDLFSDLDSIMTKLGWNKDLKIRVYKSLKLNIEDEIRRLNKH